MRTNKAPQQLATTLSKLSLLTDKAKYASLIEKLPLELRERIYHYLLDSEVFDVVIRLGRLDNESSGSFWRNRVSNLWGDSTTTDNENENGVLIAEHLSRDHYGSPASAMIRKLLRIKKQFAKEAINFHRHLYKSRKVKIRPILRNDHGEVLRSLLNTMPSENRSLVTHLRLSRFTYEGLTGVSPFDIRHWEYMSGSSGSAGEMQSKAFRELTDIQNLVSSTFPQLTTLDLGCDLQKFFPPGNGSSDPMDTVMHISDRVGYLSGRIRGCPVPSTVFCALMISFGNFARDKKVVLRIFWEGLDEGPRQERKKKQKKSDWILPADRQKASDNIVFDLKFSLKYTKISAHFGDGSVDITKERSDWNTKWENEIRVRK
ncbi:hypothetical protein BDV96DRAFT_643454 [Lophiotrema nucula]|uniref:Uncharacterized protein n=1 Tax=Lophiotrema nucula TaxID=690887 RepID=A0A6A5ZGF8_9PLEO|nr:hypothetical protein BDV96DRAFT_643454 [Lophiotrema nucula]